MTPIAVLAIMLVSGSAAMAQTNAEPAPPTAPPAPTDSTPTAPAESPATTPSVTTSPHDTATYPPEPAGPVSLEEAIRIARETHGDIDVAEAAVSASRERVIQTRAGNRPVVTGELGYDVAGSSSRAVGGDWLSNTRSDPGVQPRVVMNYAILNGGQTRSAVRQAQAGVRSNEAGLLATENNLAFLVAQNYMAQLRTKRLLELRRTQEQLAERQLQQVEARIEVGDAPEVDRALPLSELRNRQVDRIQAENDVRLAANALRNSMGLAVGPSLDLVDPADTSEALPTVETLRETARTSRPEVLQAAAQVDSAKAAVALAKIERDPRLDTVAAINLTPLGENQRAGWSIGAAVSMPLFDSGRSRAQVREALIGLESAQARLTQTTRDVMADVEEAYLNLRSAMERLAASNLAVEAARANLDASTARYEQGLLGVSVVELVTSQVQFDTANTNAIQARYDVHLARAQLDRAMGRIP